MSYFCSRGIPNQEGALFPRLHSAQDTGGSDIWIWRVSSLIFFVFFFKETIPSSKFTLKFIFLGELDCFYVECGGGDGPDTTRLQAAVIRDPAGGLPEGEFFVYFSGPVRKFQ